MNINSPDQAITLLNKLIKIDPDGLSAFFNSSFYIDKRCANSLVEFSDTPFKDFAQLFPLGLLNGFLSESDPETGKVVRRIGIKFKHNSPIIDHFYVDDLRDHKNEESKKDSETDSS